MLTVAKLVTIHEDTKQHELEENDLCQNCGAQMVTWFECLKCEECGLQTDVCHVTKTSPSNTQYQTSANSSLKTSNIRLRHIIRNASPTGNWQKTATIIAELRKCNKESGETIPESVIRECAELYVNHNWKHRCSKRRGLLAACLKYILMEHRLSKTERMIAGMLNIPITTLSKGDNILRDAMRQSDNIDINIGNNQILVHVELLLSKLSLEPEYAKVAEEIIKSVDNKNIRMEDKSRQFSKCVGAVYLLIQQVPLKASMEDISKNVIVFATYKKFYQLLIINRKLVNPVLVTNGIPKITRESYAEVAKKLNSKKKFPRSAV